MRASIHNPYLDTLGGGERYTASFIKVLLERGFSVDLEWKDPGILSQIKSRFGIDLTGAKIIPDIKRGDGYDLCFWVSDGSIPLLRARRNFLHFQVPFHHIGGNNLLNKMKLIRVDHVICNSNFTKKVIDKEFGVESIVIYPPVDVEKIIPKRKENIILSVSRFSGLLQNKGHDILIESFKKMEDSGNSGWKLILAGGAGVGTGDYIEKLEEASAHYPVQIIKNPDYKTLRDLYGTAKIFWSAAGFGEDEAEHPEKVEHFGMTVVEAMAAGAIPFVFDAGGHREIIEKGRNGYLWNTEDDLIKATQNLINNKELISGLKKYSIESSRKYSHANFEKQIINLL